jgi:hypothetical protein
MRKIVAGAGLGAITGLMALEMAVAGDGFGRSGRGSGYRVAAHDPQHADAAKSAAEAKRARRNAKRLPVPAVSHLEG